MHTVFGERSVDQMRDASEPLFHLYSDPGREVRLQCVYALITPESGVDGAVVRAISLRGFKAQITDPIVERQI